MASRYRRHLAALGLIAVFWPSIAAHAAIVLTVKQDGSDVVISGSGSANTTDLSNPTPRYDYTNVLTYNHIYAGPAAFTNHPNTPDVDVNLWSGLTGPSSFGNDPFFSANPSTGFGDLFGLVSQNGTGQSILVLPLNYVSGAILNGTSRFNNSTLAGLGLSPGLFSWSWGSHPNADSFQIKVEAVPVPAPLPLAGIAVAWRLAKRMRRASRDQRRQDRFKIPQSIQ